MDKLTNKNLKVNSGIKINEKNIFANSQTMAGTEDLWDAFKTTFKENDVQDIQSQIKQIQQQKEEFEKISIVPYGQKLNLIG